MTSKKTRPPTGPHTERVRRERGAHRPKPSEPDYLTPDDMLSALRDEVIAISRASEMRIRELTVIVTDYTKGKIAPEEAHERFMKYSDRWGDAMYGISTFEGRTDEQIRHEMDEVRKELRSPIKL